MKYAFIALGGAAITTVGVITALALRTIKDVKNMNIVIEMCNTDMCALCPEEKKCRRLKNEKG